VGDDGCVYVQRILMADPNANRRDIPPELKKKQAQVGVEGKALKRRTTNKVSRGGCWRLGHALTRKPSRSTDERRRMAQRTVRG
jgi:hypothetical protein